MNDLLGLLDTISQQVSSIGDQFSPEELSSINNTISEAHSFLNTARSFQPPKGSEYLWALADGNPRAFTAYMRSFPNTEFNKFSRDKEGMSQAINKFSNQITFPSGESSDGVPKADLQSSNVYGYQYDPSSKQLRVRFNNGGVYEYEGVPSFVYKMFARGAIPAKTDGQNQWGAWWKGKQPSLGASFYELIRDQFPYQKVA